MPLKSLKYGQQLLRNFRTYKARQRRKQENSNFTSNEMNNIDKVWGNEMMVDQEIIRSSIGTRDEENRVKYVDKNFYLNSNELKSDDMNIDKDFWSENVEMSNIENEGSEKPTENDANNANNANNERLILDVMIPLYEKILKIMENENIDINSIISLCGNGNFDFYQDQKLNGDCGKSTDYFCAEGYKEWNNFNMNFEHAETDSAHNPNNQLQNNNPDLQNNQNNLNSFGQESSTKSIPIFKDTNNNGNNGFYFPKYHKINHYNETNDKSRLKENYIDASEPVTISFPSHQPHQHPDKNPNGFWSVGDSVLTFNTWAPWKDKDEFDYELDKLLKKYKAEVTHRFTMDGVIS
ncbi:16033_t:CDS:2 [Racocetra fulgida]|uniref:16033_t:CDS:1 n=1 Tax=Racocetra fulgida TaxID=60492 RepID=A0A9N8WEB6_9GLOM|nr:16033_t:CDS:2 [Racocetra fulgida]